MIGLYKSILALLESGDTLVVPSRQRSHAARLAYAAIQRARGRSVWASADILPVETWQAREIERAAAAGQSLPRLLSPAEDWLLWRQCTAEATSDLDLLDPGGLAEGLRRASALAADFALDIARLADAPGLEAPLLSRVQHLVDERCRALGAARLTGLLGQLGQTRPAGRAALRGFLTVPPRLAGLAALQPELASERAVPRVAAAADETDELERIATWCRQRLATHPEARLLVICPGAPGPRERLATLVRQSVDAAAWLGATGLEDAPVASLAIVEGGAGFARIPVVSHALGTLMCLAGVPVQFAEVSAWLRAPFWSAPDAAVRARMDLWLRDKGLTSVSLVHWESLLAAMESQSLIAARMLGEQLEAAQRALGEGRGSAREWSERFRSALQAMGWPGARTRGSAEQQTVVRFHELLDEFGQLSATLRSLTRRDAVHWLHELAARTTYRPADEDAVVTISPALADPVVTYDGVWVAGLHADALPVPVQADPFLPLAMQLGRGVPQASAAGRLEEAHTLLKRWRCATDELVLSVPSRLGDLDLLPSPLLAPWMGHAETTAASRKPVWLAHRIHRPNLLESLEDPGVPWPIELPLPSGTRSVELQNQCAFRAYAELRLGSGELGIPEPGVGPDVRGQLLHEALQRLWQALRDSRNLADHSASALAELIEQSVAQAADATLSRKYGATSSRGRSRLFLRECRRAVRLIQQLCAVERERTPFRVQATEVAATLALGGARMDMRIDRLDELADGTHAILDYKSGRRRTADWASERPSHPQLLAYLAAHRDSTVALATVNVTAREVRFDGIADNGGRLPRVRALEGAGLTPREAWTARTAMWLATLEKLAKDFLAGRAALDPKPGACEHCHAIGICRISERRLEQLCEAAELIFEPTDV